METPDQEALRLRRKKTVLLMAGGAVSLLIPLAGALYLHWSQNAGASGPSGRSDVFERREGEDRKITPTQTAVVLSPPALMAPSGAAGVANKAASSSLDFIKSNVDMRAGVADAKAAAAASGPAVSTAAAAPAAVVVAAAKKGAKPGKKPFNMPKLQPSRGFTNFGSTGSKGANAGGVQAGTAGGQNNTQDIMKNLPPDSANNPQVQAYLKSQQGQ